MTVVFMEPGGDATYGLEFYVNTTGTVSVSSTQARTGPRSISVNAGRIGVFDRSDEYARITASYFFPGNPAAASAIHRFESNWGVGNGVGLRRRTDGKIELYIEGGSVIATGNTTLPNSAWVRVTAHYRFAAIGLSVNNACKVWVQSDSLGRVPILDINTSNFSYSSVNWTYLSLFHAAATTAYLDDVFYEQGNSVLADAGNIRITAKLPNALSTNGFDTLLGSGANRYDRVSERPLSVSNGMQHAASSDAYETFGVQGPGVGDVDVSDKHIVAHAGWTYSSRSNFDCRPETFAGGSDIQATKT